MSANREENPWKTLSTRVIYENPWIRLREDEVIRPDGKPGIYGVVETRIATGVVVITETLDTYLVGQFRYPLNRYSWEIIEGGSEPGEEALDAAKRELAEEAGLHAAQWMPLGSVVHLSNCFTSEEAFVFLARQIEEVGAQPEGTEQLQIRKLPFREALAMVERGEITDALSIIGILRAARELQEQGVL
jgi:8-oxo-dGTP pyrophosphatase MutT (NUDIX family)